MKFNPSRLHDLHPAGPSGVLCHAVGLTYVPIVWRLELDNKEKRKAPVQLRKALKDLKIKAYFAFSAGLKRLEELGAWS